MAPERRRDSWQVHSWNVHWQSQLDLGPTQQGLSQGQVLGYRGPVACEASGVTYRQLDYWARTGLVEPTVLRGAERLYSELDVILLGLIKRLLDSGISLQQTRTILLHLRERGTEDLSQITLMSDGASIYEATQADEVLDLLQGDRAMIGISLGAVIREVKEALSGLPAERATPDQRRLSPPEPS